MRVLVTGLSEWDPWIPALTAVGPLAGPVIRAVRARSYDYVIVLHEAEGAAQAMKVLGALSRDTQAILDCHPLHDSEPIHVVLARMGAPAGSRIDWLEHPGTRASGIPHDLAATGYDVARLRLHTGGPDEEDRFDSTPVRAAADLIGREPPRPAYGSAAALGMTHREDSVDEADPIGIARELGLIGTHPSFTKQCDKAIAVAPHGVPVLIQGETGTGKGLMARFLHALSPRANKPFVAVNCSALPEQLAESLLFGHVKGAFTGAAGDQPGKFVLADGGTLFLDEIGELPLTLQPKLLRALEEGSVEALGATRPRRVDVRIMAATHRHLPQAVRDRTFREDLYFRLSFATIELPPLRERRSDIQSLALHALQRVNQRLRTPRQLSTDALRKLEQQPWRGNIRDLENVIGRTALMTRSTIIQPGDLLLDDPMESDLDSIPEPHEGFSLEDYLSGTRQRLIDRALSITHGRQAAAARLLGISPQAVHKFIQKQRDDNPG